MQYQSTRNKNLKAGSAQAILDGLAPDGGLYTMPSFDEARFDYREVLNLDTFSMSSRILAKLLPDFSEQEMASLVAAFKEISERFSPRAVETVYHVIHEPGNALLSNEILPAAEAAEQGASSQELSDMAASGLFGGGPVPELKM